MITIQHHTTRLSVTETNAPKYRAIIDSGKPRKLKAAIDRKQDSMRRDYPMFHAGMTTGEYLSRYASLNNRLYLTPWEFTYADRTAPMFDPSEPEAMQLDDDLDYVEPPKAPKRKATPKRDQLAAYIAAYISEELNRCATTPIDAAMILQAMDAFDGGAR